MQNNFINIVVFEFQNVNYASRARKEAFSLAKEGFNVTLIGFKSRGKTEIKIVNNNFRIIQFSSFSLNRFSGLSKLINVLVLNFKILFFFIKNGFDVYHLHDLKLFYPAILIKFIKRKKLIYDAHELHVRKRPYSIRNRMFDQYDKFKERILISNANAIIQASSKRADFFSTYYNTSKPHVIENHEIISTASHTIKNIRTLSGLNDQDKIIVFTGNISINSNQGIDKVILALTFLDENIHFCILGNGSDKTITYLNQLANKINVLSRVHFLLPVKSEEVVSTIHSADIGIIPIYANSLNSEYSALNKLSQSLMAGLPIACSNYENLEHVIYENPLAKIGESFNVLDPESIATAVNKIFNSNSFNEMKINARKLAVQKLNWDQEEKKLIKIYYETINDLQ